MGWQRPAPFDSSDTRWMWVGGRGEGWGREEVSPPHSLFDSEGGNCEETLEVGGA